MVDKNIILQLVLKQIFMRHKEPLRPLQNGEVNSDERDNIIQKLR